MRMILFDTETTGLPKTREPATRGPNNWPHLVSIAWIIIDDDVIIDEKYYIVKPEWQIPTDSIAIHKITQEVAETTGVPLNYVISMLLSEQCDLLVAHNMNFDYNVLVNAILWDLKMPLPTLPRTFCTMEASRNILAIPFANGRGYKSPKLSELYEFVMKLPPRISDLHNALCDTRLLAEIVSRSTLIRPMMGLTAVSTSHVKNARSGIEERTLRL
jgi:DNA polymerase III epsilon subunit-like protein